MPLSQVVRGARLTYESPPFGQTVGEASLVGGSVLGASVAGSAVFGSQRTLLPVGSS